MKQLKSLETALCESDRIIYIDGVHPQQNSKPSYGWFEKGAKAVVKTHTGRKRININGAFRGKGIRSHSCFL
ncbi:MAG: hypothetical protein C5B45_05910 [Chlamydiae bacterium]|nr:MAG: hypothetical protein C5B45_05910 [Chlamydiota bacterium]